MLAETLFADSQLGLIVRRETAIPAPVPDVTELARGRALPAGIVRLEDLPPVHTLRELEAAEIPSPTDHPEPFKAPAILFDSNAIPPRSGERLSDYVRRVLAEAETRGTDSRFRALLFEEPADHDRPELVELLPRDARHLCDVGCAAGGAGAAWKESVPSGRVTGIEHDPQAAAIARGRLDRVLIGDAIEALEALEKEGARFDAFLFADILEHLEDPIRALSQARRLAQPEARLVASVPNVGHLSLVRDLVSGRFDPLPAGLADVGHLRWFSRDFLREALEEAGWVVQEIRSQPGAPIPGAEEFFAALSNWERLDRESLETYQWIAVAVAAAIDPMIH